MNQSSEPSEPSEPSGRFSRLFNAPQIKQKVVGSLGKKNNKNSDFRLHALASAFGQVNNSGYVKIQTEEAHTKPDNPTFNQTEFRQTIINAHRNLYKNDHPKFDEWYHNTSRKFANENAAAIEAAEIAPYEGRRNKARRARAVAAARRAGPAAAAAGPAAAAAGPAAAAAAGPNKGGMRRRTIRKLSRRRRTHKK